MKKINLRGMKFILLAVLLVSANFLYIAQPASAATLSNTYVRTNRMSAGASSTWRLVFKTVAAGATSVVVDFNGADATTWSSAAGSVLLGANTTSVAACPADTSTAALPGTLVATGSASHVMTITGVTALAATTAYCVDVTSATALTLPTAGEYHPTVTAGADSTTIALRTVTSDQIVVSATVPPTFNIALSGNTDSFASNLSVGSVGVTTGRTVTINTNAKNGWFAWASDNSTGLSSATAAHTVPSITPGTSATLTAGTEGYLFGVTGITQGSGGGVTSSVAAYTSNGTTTGSGLDSTIRSIASSTGTANGAILTLKELTAISATTQPATDYTDTITVIGAGYF